ncbi:ribokinase [bacterium]|nr:ribokinase [bacterium]
MPARIFVVGSSNTDMVVVSERLPGPGETVMGGRFLCAAGGKGANQAVAAARLGGRVHFIGCLGMDAWGDAALANLAREGIDVSGVRRDPTEPSGVALILVDAAGRNLISVAPGANAALRPEHLIHLKRELTADDWLLLQLEVPFDTVEAAIEIASRNGAHILLDPAPMAQPERVCSWLKDIDVCKPNEHECELLTGVAVSDLTSARAAWAAMGVDRPHWLVVTLGEHGAVALGDEEGSFPAPQVSTVDSTAAGDCFSGALAVQLAEGASMRQAIGFACRAAALSTTRPGAQPSLPTRREVEA